MSRAGNRGRACAASAVPAALPQIASIAVNAASRLRESAATRGLTTPPRSRCRCEGRPLLSEHAPRAPNGLKPESGRGVRGVLLGASSGVEVFDCGDAAQVEEILARAAVASLRSWAGGGRWGGVLGGGPCP